MSCFLSRLHAASAPVQHRFRFAQPARRPCRACAGGGSGLGQVLHLGAGLRRPHPGRALSRSVLLGGQLHASAEPRLDPRVRFRWGARSLLEPALRPSLPSRRPLRDVGEPAAAGGRGDPRERPGLLPRRVHPRRADRAGRHRRLPRPVGLLGVLRERGAAGLQGRFGQAPRHRLQRDPGVHGQSSHRGQRDGPRQVA